VLYVFILIQLECARENEVKRLSLELMKRGWMFIFNENAYCSEFSISEHLHSNMHTKSHRKLADVLGKDMSEWKYIRPSFI